MMFRKAVVALDRGPAEEPIVECLPELKRWGIGELVLAHVVKVGYVQGAEYGHEEECKAWLDQRAAPLRAAGIATSVEVRDSGAPAEAVLDIARERDADLVVVGSRSHNLVHKLFIGSVAMEVIRQCSAQCSLSG